MRSAASSLEGPPQAATGVRPGVCGQGGGASFGRLPTSSSSKIRLAASATSPPHARAAEAAPTAAAVLLTARPPRLEPSAWTPSRAQLARKAVSAAASRARAVHSATAASAAAAQPASPTTPATASATVTNCHATNAHAAAQNHTWRGEAGDGRWRVEEWDEV